MSRWISTSPRWASTSGAFEMDISDL
jgi:hypothetical protein